MSKKVVIVGANQCALAFADMVAQKGFDVTCYEKKAKEDVAYDWTDDVNPAAFTEAGMEMPPENIWHKKLDWSFVPPYKNTITKLKGPSIEEADLSIERRPLNDYLEKKAIASGARIFYQVGVKKALTEGDKVVGIVLESGEEILCDLVVDCGGVNSCIKGSLPSSFGIQPTVDSNCLFFVRRAFFNIPDGATLPDVHTNKAYLKHINELGISWCILSHDKKMADVLIGRLGAMSDETYKNALEDIRKDNEIVGDKLIKGGQLLYIPVTHPIPKFIANGYAMIGDSACMTIPMLGSGIASGFKAARLLCEAISKEVENPYSLENLYENYEYPFMSTTGALHAGIDVLKTWLLSSQDGDVDFLLDNGVVTNKVLKASAGGEKVNLSPIEALGCAWRGRAKIGLLMKMIGVLNKMNKSIRIAQKLPKKYNEDSFLKWQEKYLALFN